MLFLFKKTLISQMKQLSSENKNIYFGGARISASTAFKIKSTSKVSSGKLGTMPKAVNFAIKATKKWFGFKPINNTKWKAIMKKTNYALHNTSLMTFATASAALNIYESVEKLYEKENKNNYSSHNSYGNNYANNFKNKKSPYSEALRSSIRFGAYPHKNGITYGLPWFY